MTAQEVVDTLGMSKAYACKLIQEMNQEMVKGGYVVLHGKINRSFFYKKIYGGEQKMQPVIYYDDKTKTYYVSRRYKDWKGENKRLFKRGFKTVREAKQFINSFMARLDGNQDMVFNDYIEIYYSDREAHLKLNTFFTKKNIIEKNIRPYFVGYKLVEITPAIVMKWQNEIISKELDDGHNYSNATLKTIHAQLSAAFNHAIRYYGLRQNPAKVVGTMGKPEKKEMLFWTTDEYKRFIVEMMDKPVSFCAFEVLYWCGIRLGELLALTRSDFDLKKRKLRINTSLQSIHGKDIITPPKTVNSYRTIDIPEFLADELYTYFERLYGLKDNDRVFPITRSYLHHEINRRSKAAGVKRIRVHDLRHSHVSLLIEKGFSALAIAERVGHESIRITYKYAHLFPSKGVEISNSLNDEWEDMDDE